MADPFAKYRVNQAKNTVPNADPFAQYRVQPKSETTGLKGVATDLASALGNFALNTIPRAVVAAPGEAMGLAKQIGQMPGDIANGVNPRLLQNILASTAEMGHGALSSAGNLRDYLVKKELVNPKEGLASLSWRFPESIVPREYNYREAVGLQGSEPGDVAASLIPYLPAALEGAGAFSQAVPLTRKIAARPLTKADKLAKERKIGHLGVDRGLVTKAKEMLPKNEANKRLIKEAQKGDYNALFTLQSDMAKTAREYGKFPSTGGERLLAGDLRSTRQDLINAMKEQLMASGHEDIANLMSRGQQRYRRYQTQAPYRNAALFAAGGAAAHEAGLDKGLLEFMLHRSQ